MLRPHAPENVRPPTSAPAPVTVLGLLSCRALAPAALFPDAFAPPLRSSPSYSPSPWNFPSQPCPATILPTRGSSLSPRRCAAGRARPPRDRPPAVATARGDRPPRPRSFASAACVGLRRWPPRTSAASVARDPAAISRPSTAAAVAGTDTHSRPAGRVRRPPAAPLAAARPRTLFCRGRRGCSVSTAAVLPGRASWSSGGHLRLPRPRLQGRTLRSAFPACGGGTSRALAAMATSEPSRPLVGVVVSPALHVVSEEDAER